MLGADQGASAARAEGTGLKAGPRGHDRINGKISERLPEALKHALLRVESDQHIVNAIVSKLGWDGGHIRPKNGAGDLPGSGAPAGGTQDSSQLVERALGRLRQSGHVPAAIEHSIVLAERLLPILEWDLCAALLNAKLCYVRFSCEAMAKVAAAFRQEPPFERVRIGCFDALVKTGTADGVRNLAELAQSLMHSHGYANIAKIAERARELFGHELTPAFLEAVLRTVPRFEWLDQENGWFWYRPEGTQSNNRLAGQIKTIMAAAPKIRLQELRMAIRRDFRARTAAPPLEVMATICKRLLFLTIDNGVASRNPSSVHWKAVLGADDAMLASVLRSHGPVLERDKLAEHCRERGMDGDRFAQAVAHSLILKSPGPGQLALVGALVSGMGRANGSGGEATDISTVVDHGCLADGKVYLAWRLTESAMQSGALRVPDPFSTFLEGDYAFSTFAGAELGMIQLRQRACWDVRPLLQLGDAEIGDTFGLLLDAREHRAAGIVGAENVTAAMISGDLALKIPAVEPDARPVKPARKLAPASKHNGTAPKRMPKDAIPAAKGAALNGIIAANVPGTAKRMSPVAASGANEGAPSQRTNGVNGLPALPAPAAAPKGMSPDAALRANEGAPSQRTNGVNGLPALPAPAAAPKGMSPDAALRANDGDSKRINGLSAPPAPAAAPKGTSPDPAPVRGAAPNSAAPIGINASNAMPAPAAAPKGTSPDPAPVRGAAPNSAAAIGINASNAMPAPGTAPKRTSPDPASVQRGAVPNSVAANGINALSALPAAVRSAAAVKSPRPMSPRLLSA